MLSTMHEGGHALYDQGFLEKDADSLLGDGPGMGIHEGQSRLWENHVGRARQFSEFLWPTLKDRFGASLDGVTAETFWRALNRVEADLIRTEADELSYHLHIILRTELEAALIAGDLSVKDLEAAWNDKMKALLGVVPPNAKTGVLQDIHWASGLFGYFPTYTIGSLYAAQLAEAYAKTAPFTDEIRTGKLNGLLGWLRTNVHQIGSRLPAEDIIRNATGTGLDTAAYFRHVESPERAWA
jgi:carboxypeptidase Taq